MGILKDMYSGKSGYFGENRIDTPEYIKCLMFAAGFRSGAQLMLEMLGTAE